MRCRTSTSAGRRPFNITLGLVSYSRSPCTTAFRIQTTKVSNSIPVGVQGRELAHTLLRSQITLGWKDEGSPFTLNLSPSRREQPPLVSDTKRAAA